MTSIAQAHWEEQDRNHGSCLWQFHSDRIYLAVLRKLIQYL